MEVLIFPILCVFFTLFADNLGGFLFFGLLSTLMVFLLHRDKATTPLATVMMVLMVLAVVIKFPMVLLRVLPALTEAAGHTNVLETHTSDIIWLGSMMLMCLLLNLATQRKTTGLISLEEQSVR